MEYENWVKLGQDFPPELRQLDGVNVENETQVDEFLIPLFSRNKGVVDFYLSQRVFPRDAREFPSKLPTSAWDLVEDKKNLTAQQKVFEATWPKKDVSFDLKSDVKS